MKTFTLTSPIAHWPTAHWLVRILILSILIPVMSLPAALRAQSDTVCATEAVVAQGDTLSGLALRYLGSQAAYPALLEATNQAAALDGRFTTIQNPNTISPGWRICVALTISSEGGPTLAPTTTPTTPVTPVTPPVQAAPAQPAVPAPATVTDTETTTDTEELPFGRPVVEGEPHPLSIEYLRTRDFEGSAITVEQTLSAGSNYTRYVVSYLSEGHKIYAYMTIPTGVQPDSGWPVIVFNHGYIPPDVYRSTERYIAYQDAFARNGYIVFRPDYRGHGFSEGTSGGAYSRPDYTIDVLNALASVKLHPQADRSRIGMWGHSMGGYITIRAMVVDPEIKAGVVWAGVVASYADLLENWRSRPPSTVSRRTGWRTTLAEQNGTPEENPEFWASISANSYLADMSGPLQLHHGTADTSVPLLFSQLLYDEVQAANKPVELYTYAGDDHNIAANLQTALQRSVAFFDRHVK